MSRILTETTKAYNENKRYIVNSGGTRSGKTFSVLILLYYLAAKKNLLISIVSETFPHLRKGAIRDFKQIVESTGSWQQENWNKTESIYKVGASQIEFFSCDSPGKVHGPARDILFINEAQNINSEVYRQLAVRTKGCIFIDFNPTHEFWAHKELKDDIDTAWIHSTYLDNEHLTPEQVKEIERGKNNKYWWDVYGLGKIGRLEGAIFNNWKEADYPDQPKDEIYGLDFGFTNDPTSLVRVAFNSDEVWIDEVIYERELTNADISKLMKERGVKNNDVIIADCAEPKSIEELWRLGWNVKPAVKGKDSINTGIQLMQQYKINISPSSTNIIKEFRNYQWDKDKNENRINKPIDMWNHAIDASRYAITHKLSKPKVFMI